jgi:hypothetical protein
MADTMRNMIFPTGLANNKMVERERIMGAAAVTARFRNFSLWKRTHNGSSLKFILGFILELEDYSDIDTKIKG